MPSERLLYRAKMQDPASGLPIYVFDTTFLPVRLIEAGSSDISIRNFAAKLWEHIPTDTPFCLVFFTTVFSKYDLSSQDRLRLPFNLIKIFQVLTAEKRQMLSKVYMVHGNWLVKSFVELFRPLWGTSHVIVHCKNLKQLSENMDITAMPISLLTYVVDRAVYKNRALSPRMMRKMPILYGTPLIVANGFAFRQFSRIYNNLMAYLKTPKLNFKLSRDEWQMVMRINYLDDETRLTISILSGCIKRNQCVFMSDFSFLEHYIILMKFIYKLSESYEPILPLSAVINTSCDWDNAEELNAVFNNLLVYQHGSTDTESTDMDASNPPLYDNSYILIKLFKFFHTLLEKLNDEVDVFEDYKEFPENVKRRQILRLILAFTKVLYDDDPDLEDADGSGFDALFKFVYAVMRHYTRLRVFGTSATLEEFNNYITIEDSIGFGRFKDRVLAALEKRDDRSIRSDGTVEEKREESRVVDGNEGNKVHNNKGNRVHNNEENKVRNNKGGVPECNNEDERGVKEGTEIRTDTRDKAENEEEVKANAVVDRKADRADTNEEDGREEEVGDSEQEKTEIKNELQKDQTQIKRNDKIETDEENKKVATLNNTTKDIEIPTDSENSKDKAQDTIQDTEIHTDSEFSTKNNPSEISLETSSKTSFETNSELATTISSESTSETLEQNLCGDFRSLLKTRTKPAEKEKPTKMKEKRRRWTNELVKPSDQLTSRLIKYTEKDLIVQKERTKLSGSFTDKKGRSKPIKGRKVSELAQLYEQRLFGESNA